MKLRRPDADREARLADKAQRALALDMSRPAAPVEQEQQKDGAETAVLEAGLDGDIVEPRVEVSDTQLLGGGYFRLRELHKPGTGKIRNRPERKVQQSNGR